MRAALALAVVSLATAAAAQTQPQQPTFIAPPPPVPAPAPEAVAPQSLPAQQARPPALSDAFAGGLSTPPLVGLKPLQGLAAVGDQGPQCRAACTKARAVCGDEQDCSDHWRQCVQTCATRLQ